MKKNILLIMLGILIGTGISVYAINASEITYNDTTIDQAIDNLYTLSLRDLTFSNRIGNRSVGGTMATGERTANIQVNEGKYIVTVIAGMSLDADDNTDVRTGTGTPDLRDISCTNNCVITPLVKQYSVGNSDTVNSINKYKRNVTLVSNFYVDVVVDNTTLTGSITSWAHSANAYNVENVLINAIKVTK